MDGDAGTTTLDRAALVRVATDALHVMADSSATGLERFAELFHAEATNRESVDEPPAARGTGPQAFLATAQWLRNAFSDLAFTVRQAVVDGDLVVLHVTMAGRHTGDFVVYADDATVERVFVPTGRAFEVTQTHWQRIRDGKVVEHWANRDDQGMAEQSGWMPPSPAYLVRCGLATARARRR
jgi:predicted ester cyclase